MISLELSQRNSFQWQNEKPSSIWYHGVKLLSEKYLILDLAVNQNNRQLRKVPSSTFFGRLNEVSGTLAISRPRNAGWDWNFHKVRYFDSPGILTLCYWMTATPVYPCKTVCKKFNMLRNGFCCRSTWFLAIFWRSKKNKFGQIFQEQAFTDLNPVFLSGSKFSTVGNAVVGSLRFFERAMLQLVQIPFRKSGCEKLKPSI